MPSFKCPDCETTIPGTNCTFELCREKALWDIRGCYYHCRCKYPVRAKEIRYNLFSLFDEPKDDSEYAYIYCENSKGQGHVYYGTYDHCHIGNGYTAKQMQAKDAGNTGTFTFRRYDVKIEEVWSKEDQEGPENQCYIEGGMIHKDF